MFILAALVPPSSSIAKHQPISYLSCHLAVHKGPLNVAVSYPLVLGMLTSGLSWSWHEGRQHRVSVVFRLLFVPDFSSTVDLLLESTILLECTEVSPA